MIKLVVNLRPVRSSDVLGQSGVVDPVPQRNDGGSTSAVGTVQLCVSSPVNVVVACDVCLPTRRMEGVPTLDAADPFSVCIGCQADAAFQVFSIKDSNVCGLNRMPRGRQ